MKRKALGKGLRALIPEAESPTGKAKFHELDIELIIPSDFQPRERFDREKLKNLPFPSGKRAYSSPYWSGRMMRNTSS